MRLVRCCATRISSCWIARSERVSSADVASSNTTIGGAFSSARAIATRCRSPPDKRTPRSPTRVSYASGSRSMNASSCALRAAAMISARVASRLP